MGKLVTAQTKQALQVLKEKVQAHRSLSKAWGTETSLTLISNQEFIPIYVCTYTYTLVYTYKYRHICVLCVQFMYIHMSIHINITPVWVPCI